MMTDTINTRELIMNILLEMDREKTPCHLAVRDALDKYQFLPRQDRAFIKRVCEGTVEYGIQNQSVFQNQDQQMQAGDSCDLTDVGVPDPFS